MVAVTLLVQGAKNKTDDGVFRLVVGWVHHGLSPIRLGLHHRCVQVTGANSWLVP
jgi:hypothetical protein